MLGKNLLIFPRVYLFWQQAFLNVSLTKYDGPNIKFEGHKTAHICK